MTRVIERNVGFTHRTKCRIYPAPFLYQSPSFGVYWLCPGDVIFFEPHMVGEWDGPSSRTRPVARAMTGCFFHGGFSKKNLATHFRFVKRKFSSFHMSDFFEALTDWLLPWIGGCFPISPGLPWYSECFRARCGILTPWFLVPRLEYPFKIKHRNGKSISYSCVLPFKSWFISV